MVNQEVNLREFARAFGKDDSIIKSPEQIQAAQQQMAMQQQAEAGPQTPAGMEMPEIDMETL
jgi:coproporphyrinogen III oxidase-like Fe-S oxidoreductase